MAKLPRILQKIFGIDAPEEQFGKFGSLAAGTPETTKDPEEIQSLSQFLNGWFAAILGNNSPAIEDMNSLCYLYAYQLSYLFENGIAEWNDETTYYEGSLVRSGQFVYQSVIDDNLNNPVTDGASWRIFTGGSASALDIFRQKNFNEYYGIQTQQLSNSVGSGFNSNPGSYQVQGILLEEYTASSDTIAVVWGPPKVLNTADPNTTTTSGWSLKTQAATLTTSATRKVGATSIKWSKTAGGTLSNIEYDAGSASIGWAGFGQFFGWVHFSNASDVTAFQLVVDIDGTNKRTWNITTNAAGGALATGFNLIYQDLNVGGTAGGTGWRPGQLYRYAAPGVVTGNASTTLDVLINGFYGGIDNADRYVRPGTECDIFDGTEIENILFSSENDEIQGGTVELSDALANSYDGGFGNTSIYRSTLSLSAGQAIIGSTDPNGNALAGDVTTLQSIRLSTVLRDMLAGNTVETSLSYQNPQVYPVSDTTVSSISVLDPANESADLLSGNTVQLFETEWVDGTPNFKYAGAMVLTGNATHLSGVTTLPGTPPVGTAAGYYLAKKFTTETGISTVDVDDDEDFEQLTPKDAPNGVVLYDASAPIPYIQTVQSLYTLGGNRGFLNKIGNLPTLTENGVGLTSNLEFKNGQLATTGWSNTSYLSALPDSVGIIDVPGVLWLSFWLLPNAIATNRRIVGKANTLVSGWFANYFDAGPNINIAGNSGTLTSADVLNTGEWNHIGIFIENGVTDGAGIVINGDLAATGTLSIASSGGAPFAIGYDPVAGSSEMEPSDGLAQMLIGVGDRPSVSDFKWLWNHGKGQVLGFTPNMDEFYVNSNRNGNKMSLRAKLATSNPDILPFFSQVSMTKTQ